MAEVYKHTEKTYDKFSEYYHNNLLEKSDNFWHKYVEKPAMIKLLKPVVKRKKVLDLGCGSGIFTKQIKSLGANVYGLDISSGLINIAKREYPNINFFVGNAIKTPFKKGEFDVVASSLMVHYFNNIDPLFKEASRILKPKGIFIFSIHHPIKEVTSRLNVKGIKGSLMKPYFNSDKYYWTLQDKLKLVSYHHTFEAIFSSLHKNGFLVEQLVETVPTKEGKRANKKMYERSFMRPTFLIIKAIKK